jgi:hypothetical protein
VLFIVPSFENAMCDDNGEVQVFYYLYYFNRLISCK